MNLTRHMDLVQLISEESKVLEGDLCPEQRKRKERILGYLVDLQIYTSMDILEGEEGCYEEGICVGEKV